MKNVILKVLCLPIVVLVMASSCIATKIDWRDNDWLLMICILISMALSTVFVLIIWLR